MKGHGQVFGRFLLPRDFFAGKTVVDVGCGNGRIGRLIAPLADTYVGVELSEAIYAFPKYTRRPREFRLVRASGTDMPLADRIADATLCWGVLHHMDDPDAGFDELVRVTKPGGTILVYVYPPGLDPRSNLNVFMRGLPAERSPAILGRISDAMDRWRDMDPFFGDMLAERIALSFKHAREWQHFQFFDGVMPSYHWSIEERMFERATKVAKRITRHWPGCMRIDL
jgi:SAM-dependent methyltransferase